MPTRDSSSCHSDDGTEQFQHESNNVPASASSDWPVEILWEEASALVVNKPAGVLTQGARGLDTLETRLLAFLKHRDQHAGTPYVGLPHRLDRCVSGTLLVGRNLRAVQRFGAQFQSRKVAKVYWAICAGQLHIEDLNATSTWTDWMRKIPNRPVAEIVEEGREGAKLAVLHFQVRRHLTTCSGLPCSLVEVQLETGRMHQIRLQFASRGFPLLGDSMYGSQLRFGPAVSDEREKAIALHAREIRFRHPKTGVEVRVEAPLPVQSDQVDSPHGWNLIAGIS